MKQNASELPTVAQTEGLASGMTIVELLLALSIAVLIMGLAFSLYSSAVKADSARDARRSSRTPTVAALELMGSDIASCALGSSETSFLLAPTNDGVFLSLLSTAARCDGGPSFYELVEVLYSLESGPDQSGNRLTRRARALAGDDRLEPEPEEEVLLTNVEKLQVEVFDGENWIGEWGKLKERPPSAARISIARRDEPASAAASEIFIPAGQIIKRAEEKASIRPDAF